MQPPALNRKAPQTALFLDAPDRGEAGWWVRLVKRGVPMIEAIGNGQACVTFLWRDDQGTELTSPVERVYADVNSVTDHHCLTPQSLERIAGTDVWFWQVELPLNWRGSYCFIPASEDRLQPVLSGDLQTCKANHRDWWRSVLPHATPDPLNPLQSYKVGMRLRVSPLHLPEAPNYALWHAIDSGKVPHAPFQELVEINWASKLQNKQRKVWIYVSGWSHNQSAPPVDGYPLVLLLDGSNWAEQMPIQGVLEMETAEGNLPSAVYVFIDPIDLEQRAEDLTCNAEFWNAVHSELLPLIAEIAPITANPALSMVAGQSYGGLAATYAGLFLPNRFGLVLSQSGSFWWPNFEALRSAQNVAELREGARTGWLTTQLKSGDVPEKIPGGMRVFMEVGTREEDMIDASDTMSVALNGAGHEVFYRRFEGGHDGLCWRNGLIDGLRWLFAR
ncbi:enterochelin esterase [Phyllobacterium sp. YR531]|uniref:enterochelin esterase n=1 Tax=Phyllobacterium sp. YR531 TaxID=1144343 RepID=UPI000689283E|nr:enterochelin esterase [Phyllobacterium sp. YR531]